MIWDNIDGHQEALQQFRRAVERRRLPHACLFSGPEGIGKRLVATRLAQCLLCTEVPDERLDACGSCPACRQMQAGTHPDFLLVELPDGRQELPIALFAGDKDQRGRSGLCYELSLRPVVGQRRIAVIDDAHRMTRESANAILKTLEEPAAGVCIFLIAPHAEALLPTIRSRCQQLRFAPLPDEAVAARVQTLGWTADEREATTVAALSGGSLTTARQLLDTDLQALRHSVETGLSAAARLDPLSAASEILERIEQVDGDARSAARWAIAFALGFLRRTLLAAAGAPVTADESVERFLAGCGEIGDHTLRMIDHSLDRVSAAEQQLENAMPLPLCLEGLLDDLARQLRRDLAVTTG